MKGYAALAGKGEEECLGSARSLRQRRAVCSAIDGPPCWTAIRAVAALYAAIDSVSTSVAMTRVSLYSCIRQLSLPCAVVSCMEFSVSRRHSTYGYLCYVTVDQPTFPNCYLRLIFFLHFLFEWVDEITILSSTGAIVL